MGTWLNKFVVALLKDSLLQYIYIPFFLNYYYYSFRFDYYLSNYLEFFSDCTNKHEISERAFNPILLLLWWVFQNYFVPIITHSSCGYVLLVQVDNGYYCGFVKEPISGDETAVYETSYCSIGKLSSINVGLNLELPIYFSMIQPDFTYFFIKI